MTTVPGSIPGTIRRMEVEVPSGPDTAIGLAPTSLEEVATILRFATEHRLKVQVWGGGSHQGYGRPETPDLVLLTSRLDAVEAWEPDDLTLTIGSGTPVARFEEMLGERNQTAVMPEYPGAATIGGVVSAGVSSLKRGRLLGGWGRGWRLRSGGGGHTPRADHGQSQQRDEHHACATCALARRAPEQGAPGRVALPPADRLCLR